MPKLSVVLAAVIYATVCSQPSSHAAHTVNWGATQQKGVVFKTPKGYMPADFPKQKGVLMLNPKKPAGLFVVYPNEGQSVAGLTQEVKAMVAGMFIHDAKRPLQWASSPLAAHPGVGDESGTLESTSDGKMEVQLATYARQVGGRELVYGYFAMRHVGGKGKDDGAFVDGAGGGVKEFDELWQTIGVGK